MDYPNLEVRQSLNDVMLERLAGAAAGRVFDSTRLRGLLAEGDTKGLRELFEEFYSSIPHQWHTRNEIARFEGYYASVFYSCFAASGLDVVVEDSTSLGRVDMVVRTPRRVWLFEFKIAETSQPGEGLRQMHERGYADKYRRAEGVEVIFAAVEFSRKTRNITGLETVVA